MLSTTANADSTWGIGVGPLYNGLGFNFGKTTTSSLSYGSLGCQSLSIGSSKNSNTSSSDSSRETESNCGFGLGYINTSMFSNNRHGLGLNLGLSYNTAESQTELRLRPGYHYFFNGIDKPGFNIGLGSIIYYDNEASNDLDSDSEKVSLFLNIGYQF